MRRTILEPADVSGSALAELKSWLGISRSNEDELLVSLLQASLEMCDAFTGQAPLSQLVEERLPAHAGHHSLSSRPINSIVSAEVLAQDGTVTALDASDFDLEFRAVSNACFRLFNDVEGQAISLKVRVGIAPNWETVPAGIKQGLIRLAAFQYRDRDRTGTPSNKATVSPASVTALWRPWRTMRLR